MGADKWVECPVCKGMTERLRGRYKHFYGKIPAEEYEKIKKECESNTSIGIYYECNLEVGNKIILDLYARCYVCGSIWKHQGVVNEHRTG